MGIKISALPAASGAVSAMQFEVNNVGVSQRLTLAQMFALSMAAVTVDTPLLNLAQTWNAGAVTFTGWKLNITDTASAAASKLLDLQVGGASKFAVAKAGTAWFGGVNTDGFGSIGGALSFYVSGGAERVRFGASTIVTTSSFHFAAAMGNSGDVILLRDAAANVLAQRNGTSAQEFRLYDTFTDASNYRRAALYFSGGDVYLAAQAAGTGVAGQGQLMLQAGSGKQLRFYIGATQAWQMNSAGHLVAGADNTYDIGAGGATRPRNLYLAGGITHGSTMLLSTTTNLANAADDQTVTINNGPVSGDPTKWIPINDNGTTRYIPAW